MKWLVSCVKFNRWCWILNLSRMLFNAYLTHQIGWICECENARNQLNGQNCMPKAKKWIRRHRLATSSNLSLWLTALVGLWWLDQMVEGCWIISSVVQKRIPNAVVCSTKVIKEALWNNQMCDRWTAWRNQFQIILIYSMSNFIEFESII